MKVTSINYQLYLIADPNFCIHHSLTEVVGQAVKAGVTCVQLRNKKATPEIILQQAIALTNVLEKTGVPLIINDHVDIAIEVDAAGVHLGQSDGCIVSARGKLGADKIIGLSISDAKRFIEIPPNTINYFGVGPVFATQSKDCPVAPWGLQQLAEAVIQSPLPLVGIGGINSTNLAAVMQTGIAGGAVLSAICSVTDPYLATKQLMDELTCQQAG